MSALQQPIAEPRPAASATTDPLQAWLEALRGALLSTGPVLLPPLPDCLQGCPQDVFGWISAQIAQREGAAPIALRRDDSDDETYLCFSAVWPDLEIRFCVDTWQGLHPDLSLYRVEHVRSAQGIWGV